MHSRRCLFFLTWKTCRTISACKAARQCDILRRTQSSTPVQAGLSKMISPPRRLQQLFAAKITTCGNVASNLSSQMKTQVPLSPSTNSEQSPGRSCRQISLFQNVHLTKTDIAKLKSRNNECSELTRWLRRVRFVLTHHMNNTIVASAPFSPGLLQRTPPILSQITISATLKIQTAT